MSEFQKAFELPDPLPFADLRFRKLLTFAKDKDEFWLARQREYFRLARLACRCDGHSCLGCQITLHVQIKLEVVADESGLDPRPVDHETGRAQARWDRKLREESDEVLRVTRWFANRDSERRAERDPQEVERERSLRVVREEEEP